MNIRNLFAHANATQRDKDQVVKECNEKIAHKRGQIDTILKSINCLEKKVSECRSQTIEIFSKELNTTVRASFLKCTNKSEVDSDPNGRGRDYINIDQETTLTIKKVSLYYTKKEKRFFGESNFYFVLSCADTDVYKSITVSMKLKIENFLRNTNDDIYLPSFNLDFLKNDLDIVKFISYIEKKNSK